MVCQQSGLTGEKRISAISKKIKRLWQFYYQHFLPLRRDFEHLLQVPEQVHLLNIFFLQKIP